MIHRIIIALKEKISTENIWRIYRLDITNSIV